jgi:hypothetical protein
MKLLRFFDKHQRQIDLGQFITEEEKTLPNEGEIWRRGVQLPWELNNQPFINLNDFVKIVCIAYHQGGAIICYYKCEENGLFKSIRENEKIEKQPFWEYYQSFIEKFNKYK